MGLRPGGATVGAAALALTLALAVAALAGSPPKLGQGRPTKVGAAADGALRIADSRGEAAILKAPALAPGGAAVGSLTIHNLGPTAHLVLSRSHLAETLAPGGGSLVEALRLRIRHVGQGGGRIVYAGGLATMPKLRLGLLAAGESRRYRFAAFLPEPGLVDNGLMGSRIRFDYRWHLTRGEPVHDAAGRIAVPGFLEAVPDLTPQQRADTAAFPLDEAGFCGEVGAAAFGERTWAGEVA